MGYRKHRDFSNYHIRSVSLRGKSSKQNVTDYLRYRAYTCPLYTSYIQYIEYVGAIVLLLNIFYHFGRYLKLNLTRNAVSSAPIVNTCLSTSLPGRFLYLFICLHFFPL